MMTFIIGFGPNYLCGLQSGLYLWCKGLWLTVLRRTRRSVNYGRIMACGQIRAFAMSCNWLTIFGPRSHWFALAADIGCGLYRLLRGFIGLINRVRSLQSCFL